MENKIIINQCVGNDFTKWEAGMPIGNGRLGAMIPGDVSSGEIITLNQDSLWYGKHQNRNNPDSKKYFRIIRELLMQGNVKEADKLCYMAMTSLPKYYGAYEPMCSLYMFHNYVNDTCSTCSDYMRILDLEKSLVNISYTVDDLKIKKEYFASYPDNVMVFKISADKPVLDIHANLMRRPCDLTADVIDETIIHMPGQCGPDGIKFDCFLSAKTDGKMCVIGDFIGIKEASEIIFYVTATSSFYCDNPHEVALKQIKNAMKIDYCKLKERHIEDYQKLYNRSEINFKSSSTLPISERLKNLQHGATDKGLLELIYNFGRYLMISASRPESQAMNLQGIWNRQFAAPWECNYTININTEMNYWIAEKTGLSDCHEPLFDLIDRMVVNGGQTANELYNCEGFVAHHATDIWGDTAVEGMSFPSSVWPMGGAWFSLHMWDHYLYTQDMNFLKTKAFPVMQKSALFFTQYLAQDEDGYYVTGPSLSPENKYVTEDGTIGRHCMGPEIDNQILRALFSSLMRAYNILNTTDDLYNKICTLIDKIRPTRINKNGCIMEWDKDYTELDPGHRHISHLWGLFPGYQISPDKTPELAKACENTLNRRLSNTNTNSFMGYFGWVGGWAAACYAKLGNAKKASECLYGLLRATSYSLLNNVPVFQIDGNFGAAAAVTEMLISSDEERIILLPALPNEISEGSFRGLKARGGFTINAVWNNGKIISASITSISDAICRIKAPGICTVDTAFTKEDDFFVFNIKSGETYNMF